MRLFVALDIDDGIRERIARFIDGVRGFAPEARWARPESLHVTLKFIGEQPADAMEGVKSALAGVRSAAITLEFRGCGFFPTPKSARVFWAEIRGGDALPRLAGAVDEAMSGLGVEREKHAYTPHLTLARAASGSGAPRWRKGDRPNSQFARLQEKLAAVPSDFGRMTAREFFLYQSELSPKGSRYSKLARFAMEPSD